MHTENGKYLKTHSWGLTGSGFLSSAIGNGYTFLQLSRFKRVNTALFLRSEVKFVVHQLYLSLDKFNGNSPVVCERDTQNGRSNFSVQFSISHFSQIITATSDQVAQLVLLSILSGLGITWRAHSCFEFNLSGRQGLIISSHGFHTTARQMIPSSSIYPLSAVFCTVASSGKAVYSGTIIQSKLLILRSSVEQPPEVCQSRSGTLFHLTA